MKNAELKKFKAAHTNRLLVSVTAALSYLVILMLVNKGQSYSQTLMTTQSIVMIIAVATAAAAVVLAVVAVIKKKPYLAEYIALAVVMAFCFYCLYGVGFVTIKLMKYITAAILVAYLVLTFIYHTAAPKLFNR